MLRKVMLYGDLGKRYGRTHMLAVKSPAEAIRAIDANFGGFEQSLRDLDSKGRGVRIVVDKTGIDDVKGIEAPSSGTIKIIPTVIGAKSAIGQILSAIVIAVAVFYMGPAGLSLISGQTAMMGYGIAFSMAMGGVAQLIAGTPSTKQTDKNSSTVFNGATNTTAQGNPVPIGYGRRIVGSAVISAGISVVQEGKGTGGSSSDATVIMGFHPVPTGVSPPTLAWNKEANRWEEMDGTPLYIVPDYAERIPTATTWRTNDGRFAFFNEVTGRWDLPDAKIAAWNGIYGYWCIESGINGGPCMYWDATNKYWTLYTYDEWIALFPPSGGDSSSGGM